MARRNARSRSESAAPSRGTKRAKPKSRTDRLQSLSRVRTLCRASPKISIVLLRSLNFQIFSDFWSIFFCLKKPLNFGSAQNAQKSQKSDLGAFLAPILVAFWTPFGTNFLNISRFPENLYFATSPQRNAHFHLPNPLILEQIFDQILMFFGSRFRTPFFRHFSNMIPKNMIFGPPLESSWVQNGTQNLPKNCARSPGVTRRSPLLAFLNRPCFSLNHSNYAAVGPYWILKRRFGMKVCSFFHIFLIFRLYIISPFFTPLFHKTTVNVQPLSPPVFDKIATHSKNLRFFILLYLRLHFFNLLLFLLICRSPLAPFWLLLAPFRYPFGSMLVHLAPF